MSSSDIVQFVVLILLLLTSAFFSSSETALATANKIKLRSMAEHGNKSAALAIKVTGESDKMLSAILIGNNVANLTASSLVTTLTIKVVGNRLVGIATGILTIAILIFGEIIPKTLAARNAETIALLFVKPIYLLMTVLTPVIFLVNKAAALIFLLLGMDLSTKSEAMTEEEIRTIVDVGHEEGIIENEERKMINNVFDFAATVVRDIMIPRIDMTFIDVNLSYEKVIEIFKNDMFTRMPVYEESTDNVIGIINIKDLLLVEDKEKFQIKDYIRQPLYTYEYKKVAELMAEMRKTFSNIVIVLDEYGVTAGMLTIEDMLEEIVGDIRDEYDEEEDENLVKLGKGDYLIEGSMRIDDLNDKIGTQLTSQEYESIGGLVMEILGKVPKEKDVIEVEGIRISVEKMDKARIETVRLTLPKKL
jgi:hemolysin